MIDLRTRRDRLYQEVVRIQQRAQLLKNVRPLRAAGRCLSPLPNLPPSQIELMKQFMLWVEYAEAKVAWSEAAKERDGAIAELAELEEKYRPLLERINSTKARSDQEMARSTKLSAAPLKLAQNIDKCAARLHAARLRAAPPLPPPLTCAGQAAAPAE